MKCRCQRGRAAKHALTFACLWVQQLSTMQWIPMRLQHPNSLKSRCTLCWTCRFRRPACARSSAPQSDCSVHLRGKPARTWRAGSAPRARTASPIDCNCACPSPLEINSSFGRPIAIAVSPLGKIPNSDARHMPFIDGTGNQCTVRNFRAHAPCRGTARSCGSADRGRTGAKAPAPSPSRRAGWSPRRTRARTSPCSGPRRPD